MNRDIYERWWSVHRRAALGEQLSEDELQFYESVNAELDRDETFAGSNKRLAEEKSLGVELSREYARLKERVEQLEAAIKRKQAAGSGLKQSKSGNATLYSTARDCPVERKA